MVIRRQRVNRTQSMVVIGLLTGYNTLRRRLYIMGLNNKPTCRKCGIEEETAVHILCECEALVSLRYTHLGSFFLDPEDIKILRIGTIWNFGKEQVSFNSVQNMGHKGPILRPSCIGAQKGSNPNTIQFNSIQFNSFQFNSTASEENTKKYCVDKFLLVELEIRR